MKKLKYKNISILLLIILISTLLRFSLLAYNNTQHNGNPAEGQDWQARHSLAAAVSDFEFAPSHPIFHSGYDVSPEASKLVVTHGEPGLSYIHWIIKTISGTTSFNHLIILHIILDALCLYIIYFMARTLGLSQKAQYFVALFYAFNIGHISLILMPTYNVWLTFYFICISGLLLKFLSLEINSKYRNHLYLYIALTLVTIGASIIRSPSLYYPIFIGLCIITLMIVRPSKYKFNEYKKLTLTLIAAGISTNLALSSMNYAIRGDFSATRSTVGHTFWAGVSQRENKYGIKNGDAGAVAFYTQLTGKKNYEAGMGIEYNQVLKDKAKEYILENPIDYISDVLNRSFHLFIPNQYILLNTYNSTTNTLTDIDKISGQYGKTSPRFWKEVTNKYWWYPMWISLRLLLIGFLAVSFISIFIFRKAHFETLIVLGPIFYGASVISLIYMKGVIVSSVWTASLPAVLMGSCALYSFIKQKVKFLHSP